jgi:hypothetical protein
MAPAAAHCVCVCVKCFGSVWNLKWLFSSSRRFFLVFLKEFYRFSAFPIDSSRRLVKCSRRWTSFCFRVVEDHQVEEISKVNALKILVMQISRPTCGWLATSAH